jgi:PST family polysaccharide transporter
MGVSNALKLALQFAIVPVLARLLGPSAYGVVALAMPFILLSGLIVDAGLGAGLARRLEVSPDLESTVFWLTAGFGACLALLVCALAWPIALVIGVPHLAPILAVLSPVLLVGGLLSAAHARVVRERRFGVFAAGDFVTTTAAALAALGAALSGWGAWSLVVQQLVYWGTKAVWIFAAARLPAPRRFRPSLARELVGFGLNATGAKISEFVSLNVDNLLVGILLGVTALGGYAVAFQVVTIPSLIISAPLYMSMFTAVARRSGEPGGAHDLVLSCVRALALGITPVFVGMALSADLAVPLVLGPKWTFASGLIVRLAPAGMLFCVFTFTAAVVLGAGRADQQFRLALIAGGAVATGVILGSLDGVGGAAIGVSLGAASAAPFYLRALARHAGLRTLEIARAFLLPVAAAAVMAAAVVAVRLLTRGQGDLVRLAAVVAIGAATYGLTVYGVAGREIRAMIPALRRPKLAS